MSELFDPPFRELLHRIVRSVRGLRGRRVDEGLTFPVASDPGLRAIRAYGVAHDGREIAVPTVFVLDRDGRTLYRKVAESITDRPDLEEVLAALP